MDYEQFKERIEEDLHQAFADYGIGANFSQHHVEKLNVSYDALSVTPEGSHIGVNANLSAMFEAIENGLRLLNKKKNIFFLEGRRKTPQKRRRCRQRVSWVDLALIYKPSYIYKRWRGKIQGVREKNFRKIKITQKLDF